MAGPHMECAGTVVTAGDTCQDGAVYMPVLTRQRLFIRF